MSAGMAGVIAASLASEEVRGNDVRCWPADEAAAYRNAGGFTKGRKAMRELQIAKLASHIAEELTKAGYGNVQAAKAEALTDAADWLVNGEAAGIIAYDGPSNRGEVIASYDAALEDPEAWLRERAAAALAVDPADLYREAQDGMAEAWAEGRTASPDALNPYEDWASIPDGATR